MEQRNKIPYAITNFEKIRTENYLYVDKTRFIEQLEKEAKEYQFLIRPRKFGKTLFISVLEHYYDLRFADKFEKFFGDLYIGQHPTGKQNSYFVIRFNFSGIDTSNVDSFKISFTESIRSDVEFFLIDHRDIFKNVPDLLKELSQRSTVKAYINYAFSTIKSYGKKAYVIIDEYDHFTNDIIAKGTPLSKNQYEESIWANSITKDFYETMKIGSESVVDKIFITGITPIMLDDLTSGFNISNNLSLKLDYNEILGLTRQEVEWVMDQSGVDRSLISVDIEKIYDGYLFHEKAPGKLFNSTMIFYYFIELLESGKDLKYLIDDNLKIDYGRIRNLINRNNNREKLRHLIENKFVEGEVIKQFSIELIHEKENFFSLLFYMGLVTIDNTNPFRIGFKIPNYSVQTIYWKFIERMLAEELDGLSLDSSQYQNPIYRLAYENDYRPFFKYFNEQIVHYLSNRDLQDTVEKDIKFLLLPMFFESKYYLPISELENSEGYTDIYLHRSHLHPGAISEWVWEIKYVKQRDAKKKSVIRAQKKDAIMQLQRYRSSNFFKDKTDVRFLCVVFIGKKDYIIEEVG